MVLGFMVPNYIPSGRSDFFTPSILLFTWFCHITSGGWMVVWYDVIFKKELKKVVIHVNLVENLSKLSRFLSRFAHPK